MSKKHNKTSYSVEQWIELDEKHEEFELNPCWKNRVELIKSFVKIVISVLIKKIIEYFFD